MAKVKTAIPQVKYVAPKVFMLLRTDLKQMLRVWPVPYKAEINYLKFKI